MLGEYTGQLYFPIEQAALGGGDGRIGWERHFGLLTCSMLNFNPNSSPPPANELMHFLAVRELNISSPKGAKFSPWDPNIILIARLYEG